MDWQPIDTAPKHNRQRDGSTNMPRVIVYDGQDVFEAYHFDFYWCHTSGRTLDPQPTHWMKLPEPPQP